jgi:Na+-driven multidrug efflux pump
VLSINIAAMRSQGLLTAMAAITLMSALLNILFDYLFIVNSAPAWPVRPMGNCVGAALRDDRRDPLYRKSTATPDPDPG